MIVNGISLGRVARSESYAQGDYKSPLGRELTVAMDTLECTDQLTDLPGNATRILPFVVG